MSYGVVIRAGGGERIYADGTLGAAGCEVAAVVLRDSVCRGGLNVSAGEGANVKATIANVTAEPLFLGAFDNSQLTVEVINTLALPDTGLGADPDPVQIDVSVGSSADVTLRNSSYASVGTSLSAGTHFTFTAPGTNGNQTAPPQLVDPAAGDYRQLPGSPTIDAGLADAVIGSTDLLGLPRVQPRCLGGTPVPDIGAYELQPTEACPLPPPSPANKLRFGKLTRNLRKGTARLAVKVPGAGRLRLSGKGLVARTFDLAAARTVKVALKAKGRKAKALRKRGKVTLRPRLTFIPTGGSAASFDRRVVLKRKSPPPR